MTDGVENETRTLDPAQYRAITESATDAIVTVETDGSISYANPAVEELFGYSPSALLGKPFSAIVPSERWSLTNDGAPLFVEYESNTADNDLEVVGERANGDPVDLAISFSVYEAAGGKQLTAFMRDISARKRREQALREAYEVVSDHETPFEQQLNELLEIGRRVVGTDYATLSRVEGDQYVFEAIVGPPDSDVAQGDTVALETTNCERVVDRAQTLVLNDVERDAPDLAMRSGNAEWGISCYLGAPVFVGGEVYGTFCFYDTETRSTDFSEWETTFVELFSNWVGNELEQRRHVERLVALNELNDVVRAVSDAVLSESTRAEIEARACQAFADADSYQFAWIGEADPKSQQVHLRTEAGVTDYLDDVTLSVDPDDPASLGPTGRAVLTGETQTVTKNSADLASPRWRQNADRYGFRASAAIPIVYEGSSFGVLNVYSDRATAFEGAERDVVDHLGGIIGHAIVAAERREILLGDTVVELDIRVVDALKTFDVTGISDAEVEFDAIIPISGDEYLISGHTTESGIELVERIVTGSERWKNLTRVNQDSNDVSFEAVATRPAVLESLESINGEFVGASIEGTDLRACLHLPKNVDVRQVLDAIRAVFPNTNLVSKQEVTRERPSRQQRGDFDLAELTEKQLHSLRAAYLAGYFEWPRRSSGKEVAEKLDIAPATFSQHLRAVERKVFESLLDEDGSRERID